MVRKLDTYNVAVEKSGLITTHLSIIVQLTLDKKSQDFHHLNFPILSNTLSFQLIFLHKSVKQTDGFIVLNNGRSVRPKPFDINAHI